MSIAMKNGVHTLFSKAPSRKLNICNSSKHVRPLDEVEAELITFAIQHYKGHMSEVARRLGIGRSTLYRKIERLGIPPHLLRQVVS